MQGKLDKNGLRNMIYSQVTTKIQCFVDDPDNENSNNIWQFEKIFQ